MKGPAKQIFGYFRHTILVERRCQSNEAKRRETSSMRTNNENGDLSIMARTDEIYVPRSITTEWHGLLSADRPELSRTCPTGCMHACGARDVVILIIIAMHAVSS